MTSPDAPALQRDRFLDPAAPASAGARRVLQLLLAQDGSATRLCETVAGGPVELRLWSQRLVDDPPAEVRRALPGGRCLERCTSLCAQGQVLMDNLSYVALEALPEGLRRGLERGEAPIGHLLAGAWTRRAFVDAPGVLERLWAQVGLPDGAASRAYVVTTPQGPLMLIAETFRRGLWWPG